MPSDLKISPHEISSCDGAERIVGVGGFRKGPSLVLKFADGTGGTQIVCLNDYAIQHLVAVLKTLVPSFAAIDALPVMVDVGSDTQSAWSPA